MNMLQTTLLWLLISVLVSGCASQAVIGIPKTSPTMTEIYQRHALPTSSAIPRQDQEVEMVEHDSATHRESNFVRNPVIHMYVFPHMSHSDGLRIPGYWTSFSLYKTDDLRALSVDE